jgi:hypothetical protein
MKEADDRQQQALPRIKHVEAAILENRRVTVSEVEHDLSLSHGTIIRIIQELGFHKV